MLIISSYYELVNSFCKIIVLQNSNIYANIRLKVVIIKMSNRIRELRDALGLSQSSFGDRLGVSRDVVNNLEHSRAPLNELKEKAICSTFNVRREWLLSGSGDMFNETDDSLFESFSHRYDLTEEEQAVARYCLSLSPEQRHDLLQHVLNVADAIKAARPAPEENPDQVETEVEAYRQELKAQEKGLSVSATTKEKRA